MRVIFKSISSAALAVSVMASVAAPSARADELALRPAMGKCLAPVNKEARAICTAEDFDLMRKEPSGVFELGRDIDFSQKVFSPIESFSGSLDGRGFSLLNLTLYEGGKPVVAPIRHNSGIIASLAIRNFSVHGDEVVGVLVGINEGEIEKVQVSGVAYSIAARGIAGAVAGVNFGRVSKASSTATSVFAEGIAGGIVGVLSGAGSVERAYFSDGLVRVEGASGCVGGIVGASYGGVVARSGLVGRSTITANVGPVAMGGIIGCSSFIELIESYAGAESLVASPGGPTGGLIGQASRSSIIRSFATGTVSTASGEAGGLVGSLHGDETYRSSILDSFSKASVAQNILPEGGGVVLGGLVGRASYLDIYRSYSASRFGNGPLNGTVRGLGQMAPSVTAYVSYWNKDLAPMAPINPNARSTAQLGQQATFHSWDFDSTWEMQSAQSPIAASPLLRWRTQ